MLDLDCDGNLETFDSLNLRASDSTEDMTGSTTKKIGTQILTNVDQLRSPVLRALQRKGILEELRIALDTQKGVYKMFKLTSRLESEYLEQLSHERFFRDYDKLLSVSGSEIAELTEQIWKCIPVEQQTDQLRHDLDQLTGSRCDLYDSKTGIQETTIGTLEGFLERFEHQFRHSNILIAIPRSMTHSMSSPEPNPSVLCLDPCLEST